MPKYGEELQDKIDDRSTELQRYYDLALSKRTEINQAIENLKEERKQWDEIYEKCILRAEEQNCLDPLLKFTK